MDLENHPIVSDLLDVLENMLVPFLLHVGFFASVV